MTKPLVRVAKALMDESKGQHWGYELSKRSGVRSGALYPMLTRLLDEGLLTAGWEDRAAIREKRPPRRYYELTDKGLQELGAVVQKARRDPKFQSIFSAPSPKPGKILTSSPAPGTTLTPATECGSNYGSFTRGWRWA